ncbi:MAG TPA: rhodanese-like domain-containing protein [Myxococcota bacterium]|jgi:class 3 adenylate cyclase/rhodanese-related sulfurtransferase
MTSSPPDRGPAFRRLGADDLFKALAGEAPPLIVDVRRQAAFASLPQRLPDAVPIVLDESPLRIPDIPRDRPVVAYCLCSGEASSSRVAQWLLQDGYRDVGVLVGGLQAWLDAGHSAVPCDPKLDARGVAWKPFEDRPAAIASALPLTADTAFLPRLAGQSFLMGHTLPLRRNMVSMFVDMVDSTGLTFSRTPEQVLTLIQTFMEVVVEIGAQHCGDVKDFEGDGAFLYFEGPGEAMPAAFRLRERLLERRREVPDLPLPRISLDLGPVVIGIVGTRFRQTVAIVGPSVNVAARILKLAPPGGIVATEAVVSVARRADPELARDFVALHERPRIPEAAGPLELWLAAAPGV